MLRGQWREDLLKAMGKIFSKARAVAMGEPDMSRNPARTVIQQLAVIYDEMPGVSVEMEGGDAGDMADRISARLWGLLQRHAIYVLGLRESFVKMDWTEAGGLVFRLVTPDEVVAYSDPNRPEIPVRIEWLRCRIIPVNARIKDGPVEENTWEIWDITDKDNPVFQILSADRKVDRTKVYTNGVYPYPRKEGGGIWPWVLYHAVQTGELWDYEEGRELIEGTLRLACHWTGWSHGLAEASWPQRWGLNVQMPSATLKGEGAFTRAEATVDPTSVALFVGVNGQSGALGQFNPALDVADTAASLSQYERDLAVYAGLSPSDLQATGDAQSGYAISVSRDGLRRAQRKYEPQFRIGDQMLFATAAMMLNEYEGGDLPEVPEAYSITYKGVPKSIEEVSAEIKALGERYDRHLASDIDLLIAAEPGLTREAAMDRLRQIETERAEVEAMRKEIAGEKPAPEPPPEDEVPEPPPEDEVPEEDEMVPVPEDDVPA
jgi:hypothetical protein